MGVYRYYRYLMGVYRYFYSKAGTKEIANNLLAETQRARRCGETAKYPNSHSLTETRRHG
jgi:hypothetical protein